MERTGGLDDRDEEDCFTAVGRRVGVFVSTDPVATAHTFVADVDPADVEDYEVSGPDGDTRSFVIPGAVIAGLGFLPQTG